MQNRISARSATDVSCLHLLLKQNPADVTDKDSPCSELPPSGRTRHRCRRAARQWNRGALGLAKPSPHTNRELPLRGSSASDQASFGLQKWLLILSRISRDMDSSP